MTTCHLCFALDGEVQPKLSGVKLDLHSDAEISSYIYVPGTDHFH